jgi:indolepyruvate ferredoxin oxidoreductase
LAVPRHQRYLRRDGPVLISGVQALVRLMLVQAERDQQAGWNTRGFVSGYRGSPLGTLDTSFASVKSLVEERGVVVRPAINEELGATQVWGTQNLALSPGARAEGVFALWYGKGPGLDRAADAMRHGNSAGASPRGGVVVAIGDDHLAKSSSLAVNSEETAAALRLPLLYPATIEEIVQFGLHGFAMSRSTGSWAGLKIVPELADSTQLVSGKEMQLSADPSPATDEPTLNIRWPDPPLDQEERQFARLERVKDYVRRHKLDRIVRKPAGAKVGIVAAGKAWGDVVEALEVLDPDGKLGVRERLAAYKVAMIWPLEPAGLAEFAAGLEVLIVVEEKGVLLESQIKSLLYGDSGAPKMFGKTDPQGGRFLQPHGVLDPSMIARALRRALGPVAGFEALADDAAAAETSPTVAPVPAAGELRRPFYCSGCPHNRSTTTLPDGSRALGGIGCHGMATWIVPESTVTLTQMGGEGVQWLGQAPFTDEPHLFANLGDGTYFHSGSLAVRQAVAAGVNITYKILFNDAVAMTGGQAHDGPLTVSALVAQLRAEGVERVVVVSDDPGKYAASSDVRKLAEVRPRTDLEAVQRDLRAHKGVTVLVYEQMCAAERRRQWKRKLLEEPARRAVINESVCEGCGDCSRKSNCLSVEPVETAFGAKRRINQSSCNKDMSCVEGFCPSFVTIEGGRLRKATANASSPDVKIPDPVFTAARPHFRMVAAGIGGTGVVTVGAILAMAAESIGKAVAVLDEVGLAQKGGSVLSSIHIADDPDQIAALKVGNQAADLVLAYDMVFTTGAVVLSKIDPTRTAVVANGDVSITGAFASDGQTRANPKSLLSRLAARVSTDHLTQHAFTTEAMRVFKDDVATNMMMVGYAYQLGFIPLPSAAIEQAIDTNGVAAAMNRSAFRHGRMLAAGLTEFGQDERTSPKAETLEAFVEERRRFLTAYQNAGYADRYAALVQRAIAADARAQSTGEFPRAVAGSLFKLMAYKDEYEVARLLSDRSFQADLGAKFEGPVKLSFHLAPPVLFGKGAPRKRKFGSWILPVLRVLAKMRGLRGTWADPFGQLSERRTERRLASQFQETIGVLCEGLGPQNYAQAVAISELPQKIRGFGHIKAASVETYDAELARLLVAFQSDTPAVPQKATDRVGELT